MKTKPLAFSCALLVLLALVLGGGCGGDPSSPDPAGTLQVTVLPETLAAPWLVFGPGGYSHEGAGSQRLTGLTPGAYQLTWGTVDGWFAPLPAVAEGALTAGGELSLSGTYREGASLVIEVQPTGLAAPWSVAGPDGFVLDGTGEEVLADLEAGAYTLTWGDVAGYDTPDPAAVVTDLDAGGLEVVRGVYGEIPADLTLEPSRADAAWTVTGSAGGPPWSGRGAAVLSDLAPGDYTVAWGPASGWLTPRPVVLTLASGTDRTHSVDFLPTPQRNTAPAGLFLMGCHPDSLGYEEDEFPPHQVILTRDFEVAVTELTNAQAVALLQWGYDQGLLICDGLDVRSVEDVGRRLVNLQVSTCEFQFVDGTFRLRDVGWGLQPDHPAVGFSWYGAARFCDLMNDYEGLPRSYGSDWYCNGNDPYGAVGYRLPTEAEWEYACRANPDVVMSFCGGYGSNENCDEPDLDEYGWYCGNSEIRPHPVAQLLPNNWGLYDMHGNLFEWVNDMSTPRYESVTVYDPVVTITNSNRTTRGGTSAVDTLNKALNCRSSNRSSRLASLGTNYIGIRIVRTAAA
ncbi:MAG TPA: SUMF1/EgtB/PvdO family nonheme iron enzyme, partial [Spirochaetales bacterium]|nr:SUMF1/EgtB/PvdO family nonheme iron enzyme [Spirochaetales bacterium]